MSEQLFVQLVRTYEGVFTPLEHQTFSVLLNQRCVQRDVRKYSSLREFMAAAEQESEEYSLPEDEVESSESVSVNAEESEEEGLSEPGKKLKAEEAPKRRRFH